MKYSTLVSSLPITGGHAFINFTRSPPQSVALAESKLDNTETVSSRPTADICIVVSQASCK